MSNSNACVNRRLVNVTTVEAATIPSVRGLLVSLCSPIHRIRGDLQRLAVAQFVWRNTSFFMAAMIQREIVLNARTGLSERGQ